jgi:hypothetical protein
MKIRRIFSFKQSAMVFLKEKTEYPRTVCETQVTVLVPLLGIKMRY